MKCYDGFEMSLILYRRHRKECEGGHPEDLRSGEFDETRRGWKKCGCLIHVSGTLGGKFKRKQTGVSTWDEAKAVAAMWETAQSWDGPATARVPSVETPPGASSSTDLKAKSITIEVAIHAFKSEFS